MKYLRKTLALLCILAAVCSSASATAAVAEIKIDKKNFPDENFRQYLKGAWGVDPDGNGVIEKKDLDQVTELGVGWLCDGEVWMNNDWRFSVYNSIQYDYWRRGEYSVKGIEHFQNLKELSVGDVMNLRGKLPKLPKLSKMTVSYAGYIINFKEIKALLPLAQLTGFSILDSRVKKLDLAALKNVEQFAVWMSYDHAGAGKRFSKKHMRTYTGKLDFKHNKRLKGVLIEGADLTAVDLTENNKLESLTLTNTKLKKLDLSQNKKLKELEITACGKTTIKMRKDVYDSLWKNGRCRIFTGGIRDAELKKNMDATQKDGYVSFTVS